MATPNDVLKLLKDEDVEVVDIRFCDLPGLMQHFSIPAHELTADVFEEGLGFDGSSIRGFQEIQESDMLLMPDPDTVVIDPFTKHKTLNINCFVRDPVTGEAYSCEPGYIAKKAEDYLKGTGIADTAYFGPRPSSTSSTPRGSTRTSTRATTTSTPSRACGTRAVPRSSTAHPTSGTRSATRRATSHCPRWTSTRTSARR